MMRPIAKIAALMLMGLPLLAQAFEPDDRMLGDYIGLSNALQANGITASQVSWQEVEPMCLWLLGKDKVAYNRCRFDRVMDQSNFADDQHSCDEESRQLYPETYTTTTATNNTGAQLSVTRHEQVSPLDLQSLRRGAATKCMRELGWKNPNNWKKGKVAG